MDLGKEGDEIESQETFWPEQLYNLDVYPQNIGDLILTKEGLKPATQFELFLEKGGEKSYEEWKKNSDDISKILSDLGLPHQATEARTPEINVLTFNVGKDQESLERLIAALSPVRRDYELGLAFGYPETAVAAHSVSKVQDLVMPPDEYPEELKSDPAFPFLHYRLSRANWRREFEFTQQSASVIKQASPFIYKKIALVAN